MSDLKNKLKEGIYFRENGILGDMDAKNRRVDYLLRYFVRLQEGKANRKWLEGHACELAHYVAELKETK